MLHADARPVPVLETRRALNRSLVLHVVVLGLVLGLPYLHRPPEVVETPAIQAVLVAPSVVRRPEPVPVPAPPVAEPPPMTEVPEPVREPPKIVLPKTPEKPLPKVAEKPVPAVKKPPTPIIKSLKPSTDAMADEMAAIREDMKRAEMDRLRREMESTATAMKVSANAALVDRYRGLIALRVESKWARPLSARPGMIVTLRISMLPGGEVANVMVTDGSGDAAFDASAIEAVRRASPLPVPEDVAVFSQSFRTFTMKFRPEDL